MALSPVLVIFREMGEEREVKKKMRVEREKVTVVLLKNERLGFLGF